jgi:hypothetical protein
MGSGSEGGSGSGAVGSGCSNCSGATAGRDSSGAGAREAVFMHGGGIAIGDAESCQVPMAPKRTGLGRGLGSGSGASAGAIIRRNISSLGKGPGEEGWGGGCGAGSSSCGNMLKADIIAASVGVCLRPDLSWAASAGSAMSALACSEQNSGPSGRSIHHDSRAACINKAVGAKAVSGARLRDFIHACIATLARAGF